MAGLDSKGGMRSGISKAYRGGISIYPIMVAPVKANVILEVFIE